MTHEQESLCRRVAEGLGYEIHDWMKPEPTFTINGRGMPFSWLLTGDGMLAVKAEMAKRYYFIRSWTAMDGGGWAFVIDKNGDEMAIDYTGGDGAERGQSEPLAVLMAVGKLIAEGKLK